MIALFLVVIAWLVGQDGYQNGEVVLLVVVKMMMNRCGAREND